MSHTKSLERAIEGLQRFGGGLEGVWSAPGRVNLIGEHTDYNGGLVMPFAIAERTYVAASRRPDRLIVVSSTEEVGEPIEWEISDHPPTGLGWASYALGMAWLMRNHADSGVTLSISSEVPVGAGLSSSAALEMAVGVALRDLWATGHSDREIAAMGTRAENDVVGAPTGTMDQLASMLGEQDSAVVIDCDTGDTELVSLALRQRGFELVVADTGTRHEHATGGYGDRRRGCEEAARRLEVRTISAITPGQLDAALAQLPDELHGLVRHVVTENARVREVVDALGRDDIEAVGKALVGSHESLAKDFQVSIDELDETVEAALGAGALGARMVGGGFGGSVLALGPEGFHAKFDDALAELNWWSQSSAASSRTVEASRGASRDT